MPILNRAYASDEGRCFGAIFIPGELYSFYMNFFKPISDPNFDHFRLRLRKLGSTVPVNSNVGQLIKDDYGNGFYKIRCEFTMPAVPFGFYVFEIWDNLQQKVKATSNTIQVEETTHPNLARVFYRDTFNRTGYNYEANPDFYNIFTLPLIQRNYAIQTERKQYRNVTDRRLRNLKSYKDEVVTIESYYFDEEAHRAMSSIYDHDTVFINRNLIVAKGEYNIENNIKSILSKGSVEVILDTTVVNPYEATLPAQGQGQYSQGDYTSEYFI